MAACQGIKHANSECLSVVRQSLELCREREILDYFMATLYFASSGRQTQLIACKTHSLWEVSDSWCWDAAFSLALQNLSYLPLYSLHALNR